MEGADSCIGPDLSVTGHYHWNETEQMVRTIKPSLGTQRFDHRIPTRRKLTLRGGVADCRQSNPEPFSHKFTAKRVTDVRSGEEFLICHLETIVQIYWTYNIQTNANSKNLDQGLK